MFQFPAFASYTLFYSDEDTLLQYLETIRVSHSRLFRPSGGAAWARRTTDDSPLDCAAATLEPEHATNKAQSASAIVRRNVGQKSDNQNDFLGI